MSRSEPLGKNPGKQASIPPDSSEGDLPAYVIGRLNLPWAKQHRVVRGRAGPETACRASKASNVSFTVRQFDPEKERCQHPCCFGGGKLPDHETEFEEDPRDFDQPLVQSSNEGCLHDIAPDSNLPACGVGLEKSYWRLVEGAAIEEDEAEFCWHQDCFGGPYNDSGP